MHLLLTDEELDMVARITVDMRDSGEHDKMELKLHERTGGF